MEAQSSNPYSPSAPVPIPTGRPPEGARGINNFQVYTDWEWTGRTLAGELKREPIEFPRFILTPGERWDMLRLCGIIFSVVTSRMNRIGGLEFRISPKAAREDQIVYRLRTMKRASDEFIDSPIPKESIGAEMIRARIRAQLPGLREDLSNFDNALLRWSRSVARASKSRGEQIAEQLRKPNDRESWEDFIKKYVQDLQVHGATGVYKQRNQFTGRVTLNVLPGGSLYPVKYPYVTQGNMDLYIQWVAGMEAEIMGCNELSYDTYLPTSMSAYGLVPLDCVVSKVAEVMGQDEYWAERADGSSLPKKAIVFGDTGGMMRNPEGEFGKPMPLDKTEQARMEAKLAEIKKSSVAILSGVGRPLAVDLSMDSVAADQLARRQQINQEIAMAFNMSNAEINQTDSGGTSGRATIEGMMQIDLSKGQYPIMQSIRAIATREWLPMFDDGDCFEFLWLDDVDAKGELDMAAQMVSSGIYSVDEARIKRGDDPLGGEYAKPKAAGPAPAPAPA